MGFKQYTIKKRAFISGSLFFILLLLLENILRITATGDLSFLKTLFSNTTNSAVYFAIRILAALLYGLVIAYITKSKNEQI